MGAVSEIKTRQTSVELPINVHRRLKLEAAYTGQTIKHLISTIISDYFKARENVDESTIYCGGVAAQPSEGEDHRNMRISESQRAEKNGESTQQETISPAFLNPSEEKINSVARSEKSIKPDLRTLTQEEQEEEFNGIFQPLKP